MDKQPYRTEGKISSRVQAVESLTRSMLSRGLALLRMRMICLIWPWLTLLLMQPNTTRALGWRDGLYWNANL